MHSPTLSAVSPLSSIPTMEERGGMGGHSSEIDLHTCDTVGTVTGVNKVTRRPTKLTRRLGARLREARQARGLTQAAAAKLAKITPQRWEQMENGSVSNLNRLHAACEAINASLIVDVQITE